MRRSDVQLLTAKAAWKAIGYHHARALSGIGFRFDCRKHLMVRPMHGQWPQNMAATHSGDMHEHGPAGGLPKYACNVNLETCQPADCELRHHSGDAIIDTFSNK
jgi:hypothetical protein